MKNYILISDARFVGVRTHGHVIGQFTNKNILSDAVNYWRNKEPDHLLHWEMHEVNTFPADLVDWGYAYIPMDFDMEILSKFDDNVPNDIFFGKNIVGVDYQTCKVSITKKIVVMKNNREVVWR